MYRGVWQAIVYGVTRSRTRLSDFHFISVYMLIWQPHPPCSCHSTSPPLMSTHLFSMSVSLFPLCKQVHLYRFSRFHICGLIYDICFSLSNLIHSVWQSLGSFTSLQRAGFLFLFVAEWYSLAYERPTFFIHSSAGGHLGCFPVLATVNSTEVNIGVHVSFGIPIFFGYVPRSGIAGS